MRAYCLMRPLSALRQQAFMAALVRAGFDIRQYPPALEDIQHGDLLLISTGAGLEVKVAREFALRGNRVLDANAWDSKTPAEIARDPILAGLGGPQ